MAKRRKCSDQFEAKVALAALRGDKTVPEIAAKHQLRLNQVKQWKDQVNEGVTDAFDDKPKASKEPEIMNPDQCSQFTSTDFIKALKDAEIQISMDGKSVGRSTP